MVFVCAVTTDCCMIICQWVYNVLYVVHLMSHKLQQIHIELFLNLTLGLKTSRLMLHDPKWRPDPQVLCETNYTKQHLKSCSYCKSPQQ